jgi:hypothetical protein
VWDRARRAYLALLGGRDPAAAVVAATGAVDLRPGGLASQTDATTTQTIVVSGPADLIELREIVETATGVGTWPANEADRGEVRSSVLEVEGAAPLLGLLMAMEGLIEDRSPWRTWRTAVDTLAARVEKLRTITVEAVIIEPGGRGADRGG